MAKIIDGKTISLNIKDELKEKVSELKKQGIYKCLAVIQVGNNPASTVYVKNKKKGCEYIGIDSLSYELEEDTTEEELIKRLLEKKKYDPDTATYEDRGKIYRFLASKGFSSESINRVLKQSM